MPCTFHGPQAGEVECDCSGTTTVYACTNQHNRSGYCCDTLPDNWIDGPIRLAHGELTANRYIPFPYDRRLQEKGKQPWANWVFCCDECPWSNQPPTRTGSTSSNTP
jgi:hypothetical protein